jgi:hypothetical protein
MRPAGPTVEMWPGRDPLLLSPCRRSRPSVPTPVARHAPCCRCSGVTRGGTWASTRGGGGRSRMEHLANRPTLHCRLRRPSRRAMPAAAQPRDRPPASAAAFADPAHSAPNRGRAMPGGGGRWGRNNGPARGREVPPPATTPPSAKPSSSSQPGVWGRHVPGSAIPLPELSMPTGNFGHRHRSAARHSPPQLGGGGRSTVEHPANPQRFARAAGSASANDLGTRSLAPADTPAPPRSRIPLTLCKTTGSAISLPELPIPSRNANHLPAAGDWTGQPLSHANAHATRSFFQRRAVAATRTGAGCARRGRSCRNSISSSLRGTGDALVMIQTNVLDRKQI